MSGAGHCTALSLHRTAPHRTVLLLTIATDDRAVIPDGEHLRLSGSRPRDNGVWLATATYGFAEQPDNRALLRRVVALADGGLDGLDRQSTIFFVSRAVVVGPTGIMRRWRRTLYAALDRATPSAVDSLDLPAERTIVIGREVTV